MPCFRSCRIERGLRTAGFMVHRESPALSMLRDRTLLVPALACASVCVVLMQMGLLSLFFLVPLGFSAVAYGAAVAWLALILAAIGNAVLTAVFSHGLGLAGIGMDVLHFTVFALGFTWLMAGNPPWLVRQPVAGQLPPGDSAPAVPHVRTLFRFVAASVAAALMFMGMIHWFGRDGFQALANRLEPLFAAYIASAAGGDAVRQSLLENAFTPERIIEMVLAVSFRGGALLSAVFLLFFSRQMAFLLARLFRRNGAGTGDLTGFFAPRRAVWVFSASLPAILLSRALSIQAVELAAWNLLVICGLMFLAQGGGIVLFNLARRPMPLLARMLLGVLFVIVVFSPGINFFAFGALLILGIAENWLPMRVAKQDSPPS